MVHAFLPLFHNTQIGYNKGKIFSTQIGKNSGYVDGNFLGISINSELISLLLNESYDFVWYKNPKSSFENIFHVQVFWIKLK